MEKPKFSPDNKKIQNPRGFPKSPEGFEIPENVLFGEKSPKLARLFQINSFLALDGTTIIKGIK